MNATHVLITSDQKNTQKDEEKHRKNTNTQNIKHKYSKYKY